MPKYLLILIAFLSGNYVAHAQDLSQDSLAPKPVQTTFFTSEPTLAAADPIELKRLEKNKRNRVFVKSLYVSAPLIAVGVYATLSSKVINKYEIKEERDEHFNRFHTHIDDYLALAPVAVVYGLTALGIKGKHDVWNQTGLFIKSELIMEAMVYPIKRWSHVVRPDGSDNLSFPSGHTAQAFLSAEFLRKEYGSKHPWIAVSGYVMATGVGAMRMLNNKHWLPDVLAGAGIGILSVNLAYLTHQNKWPFWKKKMNVMPTYSGNSVGLYMNYQLGK
jgi:membrane-associated phospholipid phosphatase